MEEEICEFAGLVKGRGKEAKFATTLTSQYVKSSLLVPESER